MGKLLQRDPRYREEKEKRAYGRIGIWVRAAFRGWWVGVKAVARAVTRKDNREERRCEEKGGRGGVEGDVEGGS